MYGRHRALCNAFRRRLLSFPIASSNKPVARTFRSTAQRPSGSKHGTTRRVGDGQTSQPIAYPRITCTATDLSCYEFHRKYDVLSAGQSYSDVLVTVYGRISSLRKAGTKLFFVDVLQDGQRLQGLCKFQALQSADNTSEAQFRSAYYQIKKGDHVMLTGTPHRTPRGELSLLLQKAPEVVAPCLHTIPNGLQDRQTRAAKRHVDLLANPSSAQIIRLRSAVINHIRSYLLENKFTEVQTPILAATAGGAIARPFRTRAFEFPERSISLRIAPELWLKRLVIGGLDRVFEIGPSFRNEGLDVTHNPEFTTCEFYMAYADIEQLIRLTETILCSVANCVRKLQGTRLSTPSKPDIDFDPPFACIDFIPALEAAIGQTLPDLSLGSAVPELLKILETLGIPSPTEYTLPRLLDRLSSVYIEPRCQRPTFIINHPECLSPLSKSFTHPIARQNVAARAELFVMGKEIVNTYEEENSPSEQRRKFVDQSMFQGDVDQKIIDESYLEALEWGLPPTGGWGAGIDRICMMMLGVHRIGDVLSFGSLRNVMANHQRH